MRSPYLNSAWAGQIPVTSDFVAKLQMIVFGIFVFGVCEIFCNIHLVDIMVGN